MPQTSIPSRAALALAALCLLVASAARAQHPLPPGPRPLAERVAEADVVVLASLSEQRPDRFVLSAVTPLRGDPGDTLEVKRSPLRAPEIEVGERALWILRGARSPYALVDEPKEFVVVEPRGDESAWREALAALAAAGDDPMQVRQVYLDWIDGPVPELREAALVPFADLRSRIQLDPGQAAERARIALDPQRPADVRRASAIVAVRQPAGGQLLLDGVPGRSPEPEVLRTALQAAALLRLERQEEAVLRCLAHPSSEVRLTGIRAARGAWSEAVAEALDRLAQSDPDAEVREAAAATEPPDDRRQSHGAAPTQGGRSEAAGTSRVV